ncbi:MAG TPA: ribokinase [Acholeplasmatales bacterium]|nr:ribokinase [Acholeplasmatales bacterium]
MRKILVVGSLNMDMVFRIPAVPKRGETVMGNGFFMNPGGKGANQAVACARQGAIVRMVGSVGADVFGDELIAELRKTGVSVDHIRQVPKIPTGTALILITGNDNRIVVAAGANAETSCAQIDLALSDANPDDVYLTQMEIPYEAMKYGVIAAKAKGMFTILNPAPAGTLDRDLLSHVDLIIPNETEAESITGIRTGQPQFAIESIARLINEGVREVIITLGSDGCAYGNQATVRFVEACPVKVVDTTAAGDTFVGSIAVAIASGSGVEDALAFANAAAALTISRLGAQCSIPDTPEIESFLRQMKGAKR